MFIVFARRNQVNKLTLTQCCGSMPLTNGSGFGSGSGYIRHCPSRCQQKANLKKVFLLLTFWRYIYIIFQR
jgi:hypothetical protein